MGLGYMEGVKVSTPPPPPPTVGKHVLTTLDITIYYSVITLRRLVL